MVKERGGEETLAALISGDDDDDDIMDHISSKDTMEEEAEDAKVSEDEKETNQDEGPSREDAGAKRPVHLTNKQEREVLLALGKVGENLFSCSLIWVAVRRSVSRCSS
jgi:hypothetical protein